MQEYSSDFLFSVTEYMISNYSPIFALAVSVLLEWCCVSWLGLMIYFLNKLTGKAVELASELFLYCLIFVFQMTGCLGPIVFLRLRWRK